MAAHLRNYLLGALVCLTVLAAHGQGGAVSGQVITTLGYPAASVPVRVCSYTSSGTPCTPVSSIYSDPGLTQALGNPLSTDANGNYSFYVGIGYYIVQVTPYAGTTYTYMVSSNGAASVTSVGLAAPSIFTVAGTPVTGSGTLTLGLASETANTFWAAPSTGAGTPLFRDLTATDVGLAGTLTNNTSGNAATATTASNVTGGYVSSIVAGSGISRSAATGAVTISNTGVTSIVAGTNITVSAATGAVTINSTNSGGTVTSVGVSSSSTTQLSVSGTPVTGSGTIALTIHPTGSEADLVTAPAAGTSGQYAIWNANGGLGSTPVPSGKTEGVSITTGICTTGTTAYASCGPMTATWPTAFTSSTSYSASCTAFVPTTSGGGSDVGVLFVYISSKSASTISVEIQNADTTGAGPNTTAEIDCTGIGT